jgi:ketosteroid isomerase-like protein
MEQSSELRDVMVRFEEALNSGDEAFVEALISTAPEVRGVGTDPDEWWQGPRVLEVWKEQIDAMGGSMPIEPGDPEAYAEGSVGWAADKIGVPTPGGGSAELRFTAVFHKEDDSWKIVQAHGSFGIPNEETFGEDLPT